MHPTSLAVIGLGAIGGSLAWQARLAGVARVVGYSPEPAEGVQAVKAGAVTELADHPGRAVRGADLVVLATPPRITIDLIGRIAGQLEPGAVLTDVGSVKAPILARAREAGLADRFAGSHPMAGTHESGFAAARPDLLRGCVVYVCETGTDGGHQAARAVMEFWERVMEAHPILISDEAHDHQLAWTSHLPQAVASSLANVLASRGLGGVSFGPGAKDTTRLAASNPDLWIDILLYNAPAVIEALDATGQRLAELRNLLTCRDAEGLRRFLVEGQAFRRGLDR